MGWVVVILLVGLFVGECHQYIKNLSLNSKNLSMIYAFSLLYTRLFFFESSRDMLNTFGYQS